MQKDAIHINQLLKDSNIRKVYELTNPLLVRIHI